MTINSNQSNPIFGIKKTHLFWFVAFWVLVAALELLQDYIGSVLNDNTFYLSDSLSYKLFWLLFIPAGLFMIALSKEVLKKLQSKLLAFTSTGILVFVVSLIHLITFSILLLVSPTL